MRTPGSPPPPPPPCAPTRTPFFSFRPPWFSIYISPSKQLDGQEGEKKYVSCVVCGFLMEVVVAVVVLEGGGEGDLGGVFSEAGGSLCPLGFAFLQKATVRSCYHSWSCRNRQLPVDFGCNPSELSTRQTDRLSSLRLSTRLVEVTSRAN